VRAKSLRGARKVDDARGTTGDAQQKRGREKEIHLDEHTCMETARRRTRRVKRKQSAKERLFSEMKW